MAGETRVICPRHRGAFDCPAFCQLCGGDQQLPERSWRAWFEPDFFECGDGWHECEEEPDHEHGRFLMFYFPQEEDYFPGEEDLELIEAAAATGRLWSLTGDTITAGRDANAEWLFITRKPTNA